MNTLESLPAELLRLVAVELGTLGAQGFVAASRCLAAFAAVSTVCLAAAQGLQGELLAAHLQPWLQLAQRQIHLAAAQAAAAHAAAVGLPDSSLAFWLAKLAHMRE